MKTNGATLEEFVKGAVGDSFDQAEFDNRSERGKNGQGPYHNHIHAWERKNMTVGGQFGIVPRVISTVATLVMFLLKPVLRFDAWWTKDAIQSSSEAMEKFREKCGLDVHEDDGGKHK